MSPILSKHFIGLTAPTIGDAEINEVVETLRSGWVISGPRVGALDEMLEHRLGVPHVRCLASCSAGLFLALKCAAVGPGDEVLLPAITFAGCANIVEQLGAAPVLVDCDRATGLIDLDHAAHLAGPATRAIMPVHLGGRPIDMVRMNALRDRLGLCVVEDAAHAIGAAWDGGVIGAHGNPTSFSFHATKNMTTVEGGALALENGAMADRVKRLANQGVSASTWDRHGSTGPADYDVVEPGYKLSMTDVAAAIGIHQLRRLDEAIDRREQIRRDYDQALATLPVDLEPEVEPFARHARHLYAVRVRPDAPVSRDELILGLRERGVGASVHFTGLHMLTHYRRRCGVAEHDLPAATDYARRTISLPCHPGLTSHDQARVVDAMTAVVGGG